MATPLELGLAIGIELLKFGIAERDLWARMAAAGLSQESIDAALAKVRVEVAAMKSPTTLPEV